MGDRIRTMLGKRTGLEGTALDALVCRRLHLAPLRLGSEDAWPSGKPLGVHAKFWMVDERAFYIGSENLYPTELQEFGYIVENRLAVQTALRDYWNKVWEWSRRAAISGSDAPVCVFASG
jgi:hypothetical protein